MKKECCQLSDIAEILADAENIYIFTHIFVDGDSLGSAIALGNALDGMGKNVSILVEDEVPDILKFLNVPLIKAIEEVEASSVADVCIAVDCSDTKRFPKRENIFKSGKTTINIDHHKTNEHFADLNYIEDTSATGMIIYNLLQKMGCNLNRAVAEALYVAIITDTGNFQYTNTKKEAHLIAAELFDYNIDIGKIGIELYQNAKITKLILTGEMIHSLELLFDGKVAIAYVSQDMLLKTGAKLDETEGMVEMIRGISGVEVAIFIKEHQDGILRVSMRSKEYVDVSEIASFFSGGGHTRAAGFTLHSRIAAGKQEILSRVSERI